MAKKKWIPKDLKKGQLHRDLGIKQGKRISMDTLEAAAQGGGKTAQRARFAITARGFHHGGK